MYFYYLDDDTWTIIEKLEPGSGTSTPGELFGQSVAVSSNAMVTGVPQADVTVDNSGSIFINIIGSEGCGDSGQQVTKSPSYFPTYNPTTS